MAGVMSRAFRAQRAFREAVDGLDLDALIAAGTAAIEERPRTPAELGRLLAARWPGRDPQALSLAIRYFVPIVQVTPRGLFGQKMQPTITTVAAWLDRDVPKTVAPEVEEDLVLRYLRAFGPAAVSDIRTWSWMTGLRAVVERMRPRLRTFRDERGREPSMIRARRSPTPTRRHPSASCPSTTTCSCRTRIGPAWPVRGTPRSSIRAARSSWTDSSPPAGT